MSFKTPLVMFFVQTKYLSQSKIVNLFNCFKYLMLVLRQLASSYIEIVRILYSTNMLFALRHPYT